MEKKKIGLSIYIGLVVIILAYALIIGRDIKFLEIAFYVFLQIILSGAKQAGEFDATESEDSNIQ